MGVAAKKSLGQHFLVDRHVIDAILAAVAPEPTALLEIGPGRGALTEPLLELNRPLTVVELDSELAAYWRSFESSRLSVIEADAAGDTWLEALAAPAYGVVANLPYNAGTAILRRLLFAHTRFPWMVLMFQREVADRILYAGARAGGPMGMLAKLAYEVTFVTDAAPGAFRPAPKVASRVVRLSRRADALPQARMPAVWALLLQLFARRRARLDSAVARVTGCDRATVQAWFAELGLRADARPDHMDVVAFRGLLERMGCE